MPDVTVKRVEDFEAIFGGGFRRARAGLGVSSFGLAVIDLPANFSHYPEHDQTHDDQEEVYTALTGKATLQRRGRGVRARARRLRSGRGDGETQADHRRSARADPRDGRDTRQGLRPARVLLRGHRPPSMEEIKSKKRHPPCSQRKRSCSGAAGAPRPRTVLAVTRSPSPLTIARGRRVLVPDEVGGGGELIGDRDRRRRELAPMAVGPPSPVRERRRARRSRSRYRPGPLARGDRSCRRRPRPARRRRPRGSPLGSGARSVRVLREQRDHALHRDWRSRSRRSRRPSHPGLGDQYAGARPHHARALREHQFDQPPGPCRTASRAPAWAARLHLGQPPHPPLDLGDRLLGDRPRSRLRRASRARRSGRRVISLAAARAGP